MRSRSLRMYHPDVWKFVILGVIYYVAMWWYFSQDAATHRRIGEWLQAQWDAFFS